MSKRDRPPRRWFERPFPSAPAEQDRLRFGEIHFHVHLYLNDVYEEGAKPPAPDPDEME